MFVKGSSTSVRTLLCEKSIVGAFPFRSSISSLDSTHDRTHFSRVSLRLQLFSILSRIPSNTRRARCRLIGTIRKRINVGDWILKFGGRSPFPRVYSEMKLNRTASIKADPRRIFDARRENTHRRVLLEIMLRAYYLSMLHNTLYTCTHIYIRTYI